MRRLWLALPATLLLGACVSVGIGRDAPAQARYQLHDSPGAPVQRRVAPLVPALVIQAQPADATADSLAMAYSRRPHEIAEYQLAGWTERPVRQVPRLLQQRLEARGVAGAVGLAGDAMSADWLLSVAVDTLHHDVSTAPGQGRVVLVVELYDRRGRKRLARQRFEAAVPSASADAPAAAAALSQGVSQAFDALVPWLEAQLQGAAKP